MAQNQKEEEEERCAWLRTLRPSYSIQLHTLGNYWAVYRPILGANEACRVILVKAQKGICHCCDLRMHLFTVTVTPVK